MLNFGKRMIIQFISEMDWFTRLSGTHYVAFEVCTVTK